MVLGYDFYPSTSERHLNSFGEHFIRKIHLR
jgi:hypothetical protein